MLILANMLEVRCQCLVVAAWSAAVVPEQTVASSRVVPPDMTVGGL